MDDEFDKLVANVAVDHWNREFTGASSFMIAELLCVEHAAVIRSFERLESHGFGKSRGSIFFPSRDVLNDIYYSSDLPRNNTPEYKARLHRGGNQVELCYFQIGVLQKYFSHPECYRVEDCMSGGNISLGDDEQIEVPYISVRYGKRLLVDGSTTIAAILKDLSNMGAEEQRYWHSFEIIGGCFSVNDREFQAFLARTYEGDWVDTSNPLREISRQLELINSILPNGGFFRYTKNPYLVIPALNTYKGFCDSCQELYKIVGPDSINRGNLKMLLMSSFGFEESFFVNVNTGRDKSALELASTIERELATKGLLVEMIDKIKNFRVDDVHRVTEPQRSSRNYLDEFTDLCSDLIVALQEFASALKTKCGDADRNI